MLRLINIFPSKKKKKEYVKSVEKDLEKDRLENFFFTRLRGKRL